MSRDMGGFPGCLLGAEQLGESGDRAMLRSVVCRNEHALMRGGGVSIDGTEGGVWRGRPARS